ncbi:MAG: DNA methyltransferase, partial [Candidatus Hydrogenedentota bacterium]
MNTLLGPRSIDLIVTSPPYPLTAKKPYGNPSATQYLDWFGPFGRAFRRVLKIGGSLVIDLGGVWIQGSPTKSLYQYEVLIALCRDFGFHLAQDFFWYNPAKVPTSKWVTQDRVRVKDAVNCVWWLSPSRRPKADNRQVLIPYTSATKSVAARAKRQIRPSGHRINPTFATRHRGAIPPNLLAFANTDSTSFYFRYCRE